MVVFILLLTWETLTSYVHISCIVVTRWYREVSRQLLLFRTTISKFVTIKMKRKLQDWQRQPSSSRFLEKQPKTAIFVSHSGAPKTFLEHLRRDLEAARYSVFIDKDLGPGTKDEYSVTQALKAAQECRLGILLLTEEFFTKSKWPMTQLVTFVASQATKNKQVSTARPEHVLEPKILPLYYTLSRPEFKSKLRQASWFRKWEEWAKEDPRIDLKTWKVALRSIDSWKGIDLRLLEETSDDVFRREIVKRVAEFKISPTVLPLVAATPLASGDTIIGGTRWCEGINRLFSSSDLTHKTGACVLGIHGMSGIGKTTLAKSLCNRCHSEFAGRVCHLELKSMNLLDLQKKVLRELSLQQDKRTLDGIEDAVQAWNALEVGLKEQNKVLLVIDNIWDDQSFVAERFLNMKYAEGSKLLLITRNMQVLLRIGLPVTCCENMPCLREEEAMELFIQAGRCDVKDERDQANIRKWVSYCYVGIRYQYHPLALIVLAGATTNVMGRKPSEWIDDNLDFKVANRSEKQVSEVLRFGYNSLPPTYRPIFVSLILFAPRKEFVPTKPIVSVHSVENTCRWLAIVHNMGEDRALAFLQEMKAKHVVEQWQDTSDNLRIQDSYLEFAESELQQGRYRASHVIFKDDKNIPYELKTSPSEKPNLSQRHVLNEMSKELKLLQLVNCSELKTVDLGCMTELRYLVVEGCPMLEKIHGLKKLSNLAWLQWNRCNIFLVDVPLQSNLQVLRLEGGYYFESKGPQLQDFLICKPPQVHLCKAMKELSLTKFPQLERAPELSALITVETIIFNGCIKLKHIPDLSTLSSCLRSLHLSECASLERIPGLENLTALLHLGLSRCTGLKKIPSLHRLKKLRFLDLSATGLREIPGIQALHELAELHLNSCENFSSFPDLSGLHKLKKIFWRGCRVGRDGVTVAESKCLDFSEKSDESDVNASDSDESNSEEVKGDEASDEGDDDDGKARDTDNEDDELESEYDEGLEEEPSEKEEDEEGSAEELEYGDGDDEDNSDSNSDGNSG